MYHIYTQREIDVSAFRDAQKVLLFARRIRIASRIYPHILCRVTNRENRWAKDRGEKRAHTHRYMYIDALTHIHVLFGLVLWNVRRLYRRAYFVHADSCTFLFILRLYPEGLGTHRLAGPGIRLSPSQALSFSLDPSKISKSVTRREREGGFVWAASYLSRSRRVDGFPLRCWWNLTTRELPGTVIRDDAGRRRRDATFAAFNCGSCLGRFLAIANFASSNCTPIRIVSSSNRLNLN